MIDLHWSWSNLLFSFIFLSQATYFWSLPFPFYFLVNIYVRSIIIDHFSLHTLHFLSALGEAAPQQRTWSLAALAGRGRATTKNMIARSARHRSRSDLFMIIYDHLFISHSQSISKIQIRLHNLFSLFFIDQYKSIPDQWSLQIKLKQQLHTTINQLIILHDNTLTTHTATTTTRARTHSD